MSKPQTPTIFRGKYFLFRLFGINCKYSQCPKFHDWLHLNTKTLYPGNHDSYDIFSVIIFLIINDDETIFRKSFVISRYLRFFSSNQFFRNFISQNVSFTNFLLKTCERSKIPYARQCGVYEIFVSLENCFVKSFL